jgi:hypothetical protein
MTPKRRAITPSLRPETVAMTLGIRSSREAHLAGGLARSECPTSPGGLLVVNGDDWGGTSLNTNRILECSKRGAISSVSAMVFMEDSERAAALAREHAIEAGLHLNLTMPFSESRCPAGLQKHQQRLARFLLQHRFMRVVFNPRLIRSFEYVVKAQFDEFRRTYGADPVKLDGHHHMHLCANVLVQRLLPGGTLVRRSYSFGRGQKGLVSRLYRKALDRNLAARHRLMDFFFSLPPLEPPSRLQKIYLLARHSVVELEAHPLNLAEYQYLAGGEIFRQIGDVQIAPPSAISWQASAEDPALSSLI